MFLDNKSYYSADEYFKKEFGKKIYRLSLDGGMTCPNRDGNVGYGGCIFCSAKGSGDFSAGFSSTEKNDIKKQLETAKSLIASKLPKNNAPFGYAAYFQSFTSTYASPERLRSLFFAVAAEPDIDLIFIATRPDCLGSEVITILEDLNRIKPVYIELGLQTTKESSVAFINRCYPNEAFSSAVCSLKKIGIPVIVHIILGLPYETFDDMKATVDFSVSCGIHGIKFSLLHILDDSRLYLKYDELLKNNAFGCLEMDTYVDTLISLIEGLPDDIVIYRLTGDGSKKHLTAPLWSAQKKNVLNTINRRFKERNTWQGKGLQPCSRNL